MGLTPLRWAGLLAALGFAVLSIRSYRQGKIGNGDLLVRFVVFVLPLVVFSLEPGALGWVFDELSFRQGGGHRIWAPRCWRWESSSCSRSRWRAAPSASAAT